MRKLIIIQLIMLIAFSVSAQKLPNVQEKSIRTPLGIKIDGKPTEWNNQFQAYNKATEIFYIISNDNEKLYLTVQATDLDIINKIICGGITFTVNGSWKVKNQGGRSVTFPVIDIGLDKTASIKFRLPTGPPINVDKPDNMPDDIFIAELNKELAAQSKDIAIAGIQGIKDTISIYNPEGIKAVVFFNSKTNMTYELAVPLKYLGLSVSDRKPIVYTIQLSGFNPDLANRGEVNSAFRAQRKELRYKVHGSFPVLLAQGDPGALRVAGVISPTYFSGEYTLAK